MPKFFGNFNKMRGCIGGAFLCILTFFFQKLLKSPEILLYAPGVSSGLPPLWILYVLDYALYFGMGACLSEAVLGRGRSMPEALLGYQGGLCLLLAYFCKCSWYFLLFDAGWVLLSLAFLLAGTLLLGMCYMLWRQVPRGRAVLVGIGSLFWLYLSVLQILAILYI